MTFTQKWNVRFFLKKILDISYNYYDREVITGITFTGKWPKMFFFLIFFLDIGYNCYDRMVITGITFTQKWPKILDFVKSPICNDVLYHPCVFYNKYMLILKEIIISLV